MDESYIPGQLKDCPECGIPRISFGWCRDCSTNSMKENSPYWTSGNKEIDELISYTQLNASHAFDYWEWIPFERFEMVKHTCNGGFSEIYSAIWMEGPRLVWDDGAQDWSRTGPRKVVLKRLDNSQNISSSYINQIKAYHKCITHTLSYSLTTHCLQSTSLTETYGITKDPTSNFMIVMKYYENGNLYQYLDRSKGALTWINIIDTLQGIAKDLEKIHAKGKIHKNLHGGNLLVDINFFIGTRISDVGLHGPCDHRENNQIYGVLPYIAPEILRDRNYSTASDIYSFGIIMGTIASGKRPWHYRAHDISLAKDICDGERLEIPVDTPKFYAELMQRCWDDDPNKRPTASYLYEKFIEWITLICQDQNPSEISDEHSVSEEKRKVIRENSKTYTHPEIHPEAHYTSRCLYDIDLTVDQITKVQIPLV